MFTLIVLTTWFVSLYIFQPLIAFLLACVWIFPWVGIGKPKILKRSAMMVFIMPALTLLTGIVFFNSHDVGTMFWSIIGLIPFLCIYFNARRFDKSLKFTRSLLFWLKPERADKLGQNIQRQTAKVVDVAGEKSREYAAKVGKKISEYGTSGSIKCPQCGDKVRQDARFCAACGDKLDGQ